MLPFMVCSAASELDKPNSFEYQTDSLLVKTMKSVELPESYVTYPGVITA